MKCLLLIIRHLFPRRYWKEIRRTPVLGGGIFHGKDVPKAIVIEMEDQFGNRKVLRIRA